MRLAILADTHSNFPALRAVLNDIDTVGVDEIIVAGDSINGGPFPCEVLDLLASRDLTILLGNHDEYILKRHDPRTANHFDGPRWGSVRWTAERVNGDYLDCIRGWPLAAERGDDLLIVHGSPGNLFGGIPPDAPDSLIEERFGAVRQRWVVTAHTHMPFVRGWRGLTLVNPGSVGMPLDGNPAASYIIMTQTREGFLIQNRRVPYDTCPIEQATRDRGLLAAGGNIAYLLMQETLTGQHLLIDYLHRVEQAIHQNGLSEEEALQIVPLVAN